MDRTAEKGTLLDLLDSERRRDLLSLARTSRFPRGQRLMHEGEPGNRVMVLLSGHVKTSSVTDQGQELVLSFCGPGDVLGELSFVDAGPRSSSVTAVEDVEAAVLSSDDFRRFMESDPEAAVTLIDVIGRRFRNADLQRIQFGASDSLGRVAARLVELAERYGEPDAAGIRIALPITQEELGAWAASSRAGVAQALRTLRELGWIETDRRRITVRDLEALRGRVG
jgi:CRP/FNR family transcriptional regulator, cyclic AMP receptor protein